MTLSEKSAYLKGLMDGLELSKATPEGKMISGIVDLLQEVTASVANLEENAIAVSDELDEIEEDLDAIEEYLMDEDDDEYDDDEDDYDFADDDGEDFDYDEDVIYDVTCPTCGEVLHLDEETILKESIHCPKCNELLEFDFDEDDEDEDSEF